MRRKGIKAAREPGLCMQEAGTPSTSQVMRDQDTRSLIHHAKKSGLYPEGRGELGKVWGQKRLGQLYFRKQNKTPAGHRLKKHRKLPKQKR